LRTTFCGVTRPAEAVGAQRQRQRPPWAVASLRRQSRERRRSRPRRLPRATKARGCDDDDDDDDDEEAEEEEDTMRLNRS
jgi:hypothetical protein